MTLPQNCHAAGVRARRALVLGAAAALMVLAGFASASAESETHGMTKQPWTFAGFFGHYDAAQLQRGFQVYREVCAACHGLRLLSFRNLGSKHGPQFSEDAVKAIAAEATVPGAPNEDGEPTERPAIPSDRLASPFPNDSAARAANGGALPPDLSLIAKARGAHFETAFAPAAWAVDIATGYQEGGPDYLHALMLGYASDEPNDAGLYENHAFPGGRIAMPPPLSDGVVTYADGSSQTRDQYARDISAFLMWAAEPHLEERKQLGIRVLIYLFLLAILLYLTKRRVWSRIEH